MPNNLIAFTIAIVVSGILTDTITHIAFKTLSPNDLKTRIMVVILTFCCIFTFCGIAIYLFLK